MRKLSLASALLLSACMVGPDYKMPSFDMPDSWSQEQASEGQAVKQDWWTLFNDPTLNALEAEGLTANADIALAAARVAEARASLRLSDADLYPSLSAEAAGSRLNPSEETRSGSLSGGKPYNDFGVSAVLNYEVDLWGKLRRASESSRASLLSEQANRDAVGLAVASDIATGYFNLLALDRQITITKRTIQSRQGSYDYQQKQYNAGAVDVLTFRRAEAELAAAQSLLPTLTQARLEQQNAISILLGRSPKAIVETTMEKGINLAKLPVPPSMPKDAPSTLLQRRPDISAAEQQLIAANAQIGVAKADYYPTLSLSALLGLGSADVDNLLRSSAKTWQLGAASAMPLLDFGRTGANVNAAEARTQQALVTYQQTVRLAFGEVANALNRVKTTEERAAAQTRQVKANEETVRVAGLRYTSGYATQLDKLDAERQLFQAQLDQVEALQARLGATVTLYKALGGGWNTPQEPVATPAAAPEAPAAPFKKEQKEAPTPRA